MCCCVVLVYWCFCDLYVVGDLLVFYVWELFVYGDVVYLCDVEGVEIVV